MIEAINLNKKFNDSIAINNVSLKIKKSNVFGLIGTNGAGKSTFLRMASGIYKPDNGIIKIENEEVFENLNIKKKIFYISDEQYFFEKATPEDMKNYYNTIYENFDTAKFDKLIKAFDLDCKKNIHNFSKGMKKQVSVICGISSNADYLFCDETFDGLDPVARQVVKMLFIEGIEERGLTPVIASHNLRELEDICDNIGILHKGGVILLKELADLKEDVHKVQIVFEDKMPDDINEKFNIVKKESRGILYTLIIKGNKEELVTYFNDINPKFYELLPLSLEEIFIVETEEVGYDIKSLII